MAWVWTVLVVATVVGAFFLGRWLWRIVVALMRQVSASSAVVGESMDRLGGQGSPPVIEAQLFTDRVTLRGELDEVRRRGVALREGRAERDRQVRESWKSWNLFADL